MSTVVIILLIIFAILALVLIRAAFSPAAYELKAEIVINKSTPEVFNYIKYLKNSELYNKWVMTDPNMQKEYRGTDGEKGFTYMWNSKNGQVGEGAQEITNIKDGERVDYEIRFIRPFKSVSTAYLATQSAGNNQTKVIWVFAGKNNYMMKVMHVFLNLKKVLQQDLQTSLNNLKTILEK